MLKNYEYGYNAKRIKNIQFSSLINVDVTELDNKKNVLRINIIFLCLLTQQ
jgi:hypothetical protein